MQKRFAAGIQGQTMNIYGASYVLPIGAPPIEGGGVVVEDSRIVAIAPLHELKKYYSSPVIDYPGAVIMPGLVNAHTHLELSAYQKWRQAANLHTPANTYHDWIREIITIKRNLSPSDLEASFQEGVTLAVTSGTTMVGDILAERSLLRLYSGSPLSGRVYLEFIGRDPQRYGHLLESLESDCALLSENFLPGISPHTPFTVSEELFSLLQQKSRVLSIPQTIHLAESPAENEFFMSSTGTIADIIFPFVGWNDSLPEPMNTSSTSWLDARGWLTPSLSAVHAVNVTDDDISLLKRSGSTVVICARSNHSLGVGMPPVEKFISAGIPLAIGTDSLATVSTLSMFDEIRFLLDSFPEFISPAAALYLATTGGAKAVKMGDYAGTLETGKRADFIIVAPGGKLKQSALCEQVINSANIEAVYIGGRQAC